MASLSEFTQAVNSFQNTMKGVAQQRAINSATEQMNQINATVKDEQQKFAQLSQLSNNLTLQMNALGADPTSVAQAAGAVGPTRYRDLSQMFIEAAQTGNTDLAQRGVQAQELIERPQNKRLQAQLDIERQRMGLDLQKLMMAQGADAQKALQATMDQRALNFEGAIGDLSEGQKERVLGSVPTASGASIMALAPSKAAAEELRKELAPTMGAIKDITELQQFGFFDKFDRGSRAKIAQLRTALKASARIQITGGGNVSEMEQAMLDKFAADPTELLTTEDPKAALAAMKDVMSRKIRASLDENAVQILVPTSRLFKDKAEMDAVMSEIRANPNSPEAAQALRLIEMRRQDMGATEGIGVADPAAVARGRKLLGL